jgi:hypothetical protein
MLYLRPTFTCPAAGQKTSEQRWDLAFLNKEEYKSKYAISDEDYQKLFESQ